MAFKMISPAQLEIQLRRFEIRLSQYCAARFKWLTPLAAALLVLVAFGIKSLIEVDPKGLQASGMFLFVRHARYVMPLLLAGAGISIFFHRKSRAYYTTFITLMAWAFNCYMLFLGKVPMDVFIFILCSLPVNSIFTYYLGIRRREGKPRLKLSIGMVAYFAITWFYVSVRLYSQEDFGQLLLFWNFKLQYMILVAIQLAYAFSPRPIDPFLAYNPMTAAHSILWPVTTLLARRNRAAISRFWWNGFWCVLLGYLIIYLRIQLDKSNLDLSKNLFIRSTSRYVLLILSDVGVFNLVTGVARLYGYRVRDATSFSWLARTPAEYWRRGSVYHYEFINRYLYLRLWKRIRIRFVVAFICFFFFYVMKNGVLDVGIMFLNWTGADIHGEFYRNPDYRYSITLFLLHFLLLYTTQRYWFFEWSHHKKVWQSWASVLATYALQISAIVLAIVINTHGRGWLRHLWKMFT
jgi:hypothetical protein